MTTAPMPEVCLASGGDEVRTRAYVNHRIYASEAGFDYHLGIGLVGPAQTLYHHKFAVIDQVIRRYAWTVWVDDDVYFTNWDADALRRLLEDAERDGLWCVIAEGPVEPMGVWSAINTGVIALRNDQRTLAMLDRARNVDLDQLAELWDASSFGLFTHGDQDAIWWVIQSDSKLLGGTRVVGHQELNSRPHLIEKSPDEVLTVHFCGPGDKRARVARFGQRYGMGIELVPDALMDKYGVRRREKLSGAELRYREGRDQWDRIRARVRRKIDFVRSNRRWR